MACVVGFWIICLVAGKLRPDSSFGAFVGTADGVGTVIVGSIFFAGVAGAVLEKLGYPIATRGERSCPSLDGHRPAACGRQRPTKMRIFSTPE